jgi:hypothetical protein
MKMLERYLEKVATFEQRADQETDPKLKANLMALAMAYRIAAAERAAHFNLPYPPLKAEA